MLRTYILFGLIGLSSLLTAQTVTTYPIDTVNGVPCYRYKVEKKVGIFRISRNFGVSEEAIVEMNPQLRQRGPQYEEVLFIPVVKPVPAPVEPQPEPQPQPVSIQPTVAKAVPTPDTLLNRSKEDSAPLQRNPDWLLTLYDEAGEVKDLDTLRLAFLLPFNAQEEPRQPGNERFLDFYMGALLAVMQVQATDQPMAIKTYDVPRTDTLLRDVLTDPFLLSAHAIIGPAYATQVPAVARFVKERAIWLLIPFTSQVSAIEDNPYILQFNPTAEMEAETLTNFLLQRENPLQCIFIEAEETDIPRSILPVRNALQEKQIPIAQTSLHHILTDSLDDVLKDSVENIFLFNTERYSNLQVLMPHLRSANQRYLISLISQYTWQRENINIGQIYTSMFASEFYSQADSLNYDAQWAHYCRYKPSSALPRYDLLGYDLTRHLLRILQQLYDVADPAYTQTVITRPYHGLQSDIRYKRVSDTGGYINNAIHVLTR